MYLTPDWFFFCSMASISGKGKTAASIPSSAEPSSSSSLTTRRWKYDVYLSFMGVDTRTGFTSHLDHRLQEWGITTIFDDEERRGVDISSSTMEAIESSRFAIVVLSQNYVASSWRLEELTRIFQFMEDGSRIFPVFYRVHPGAARNPSTNFRRDFDSHEIWHGLEKSQQWRDALYKVGSVFGWLAEDYKYELELVNDIVESVRKKIQSAVKVEKVQLLEINTGGFGVFEETREAMDELMEVLTDDDDEVGAVGVYGMGGVGKTTMGKPLGSSSSSAVEWKYDVYMNFRGADTRSGFTSLLYDWLKKRGINAFMDNSDLQVGDNISGTLLKAIEQSRFAIVVLSQNYGHSTWCLEELIKICECMKDQNRILPVFYDVDPSDVRYQRHYFEEAFACHENSGRHTSDKVKQWRDALNKVANFSGWDRKNFKTEMGVFEDIMKYVCSKVQPVVESQSGCCTGKPKLTVTSWKKGSRLGSGAFGTVFEGISDGGCFIAVKEVSLLDQGLQGGQRVSQLEQEISLLSQFEHENIVQYYGTQKDESNFYIFLEFVTKGSIRSVLEKYTLTDLQVAGYTRQILQGLKYLHNRNVIHRDIKCANILVHANGSVKLADFGMAKIIMSNVKSSLGTVYWMAPEVKVMAFQLIIWSLGCTVLEMLTGKNPYPDEWQTALWKIGNREPPPVPNFLSKEAQHFIHLCLKVKPDDRPSAAQLLEHLFVNKSLPSTSSHSSGSVSPYNHHRQS